MTLYGMSLSFGLFGSAVLAVSSANILYTPRVLTGRAAQGAEKTMLQCKHCSAAAKTWVCYCHCFPHKSKTQHYIGCHEEN